MPWFGSSKKEETPPSPSDAHEEDTEAAAAETTHDPTKQAKEPRINHGVPAASHTLKLNQSVSSYDYVDAANFMVRGPNYLSDRQKIPSKPAAFELVEVSGFISTEKTRFTTERSDSFYARARAMGRKKFLFVMHFDLNPMHTVMTYEVNSDALESDAGFGRTFRRWLDGDDSYKNKRLKLITSVVDANWIVRRTIGKPVPALIGNKLACYYRQTPDLVECTCDVNSSMAAAAILTVVKNACKGIICDLVLLIEAQQPDELPERVIGGTRYIHHDLSNYLVVEPELDLKKANAAKDDAAADEEDGEETGGKTKETAGDEKKGKEGGAKGGDGNKEGKDKGESTDKGEKGRGGPKKSGSRKNTKDKEEAE